PSRPTVAEAATTLWIATMLPAAAPTACAATTSAPEIPSEVATPYWNWLSIMLLTVFEPAMKAPSAPTEGASSGYTSPTLSATHCAIAIGMLGRSAALTPELIRMRTIGTVKSSTKPAPSRTRDDSTP